MFKPGAFFKRCSTVKSIPVFAHLEWYRIQAIARYGEIFHCRKGDRVVHKGAEPDFVYFVISGRLQSFSIDAHGNKDDLEFIHRGMFFGIISALTGQEHSQTFEAINDSSIFRIPVAKFRQLLKQVPDLSLKFSKLLSQRIRSKVTKTELVSQSTIIAVYAPISGSGGSTYAVNLAMSLAKETGDRIIWVSIRSSKPSETNMESSMDDIRPKWKLAPKELSKLVDDFEHIPRHVIQSEVGVDLLNVHFDAQDNSVVGHISEFVSRFIDEYRYVIVDLPSDMDDVVMKTLSQSDFIHLVMQRKRDALEVGRKMLDRIEEALKQDFNDERVKIIIGGVHAHRNISEASVREVLDYDILAFLPHIQRKDLSLKVDTPTISFMAISLSSNYGKMITRISRQMSGVSIGLVLGGGAAFGLAHIGVLKVLEEEGIPVDIVAGSSMGALIGGLWAVGYRAADLEKMALEFKIRSNLIKLIDLVFPLSGLISGKAVMSWLHGKFGKRTFRDTKIPLKVVAYDLVHRRDVILEEGTLVDAIRKSISIPGVFQPIISGDQIIIDGGVMNPLPTNVLVTCDVKKIIAVNVLQTPEDVIKSYEIAQVAINHSLQVSFVKEPLKYISNRIKLWVNKRFFPNISDIIVRTLEASESVIAQQSGRAADIVIHPDLTGLSWFELYQAEELIKRGESAARLQIDKLRIIVNKKKR
ncbi:MAG: patatin-like phospholipase family protein [Candidatus Omnitrophota bacterium]